MSRNTLGPLGGGGKSASQVQSAVSASGATYFPQVSDSKSTNDFKSQNSTVSMPHKES